MSGLLRPLPGREPVSLLGKSCGRIEVADGGDLKEEGGRDDSFDFLSGCGGLKRSGNWGGPLSSSMSEHKKSRVTAVRSADVEIPSSSSVMEISIGGTSRTFSAESPRECEAETDMTELEEG